MILRNFAAVIVLFFRFTSSNCLRKPLGEWEQICGRRCLRANISFYKYLMVIWLTAVLSPGASGQDVAAIDSLRGVLEMQSGGERFPALYEIRSNTWTLIKNRR